MIINNSGGGASLNYKVIGGTSQPTSASENTIWVNTSTAITSYVFSAEQPSSPSAGMVWFNIGTSCAAPINVLKKNGLWVYPTACQQYISGAWVAKEAKTYQNGAWVDWSVLIIVDGVMLINLDVLNAEWNGNSGNGGNNTSVTQKDGYVSIKGTETGWGAAYTKCNVSGKTTVKVEGTLSSGDAQYMLLAVWSTIDQNYIGKNIIASTALTSTGATLDVSSLSGEVYVGVTTVYTGEHQITQFNVK